MISDNLLQSIQTKVREHHELYPSVKLDGVFWESRLLDALQEQGHKNEWNAGGHGVGTDIVDSHFGNISCKGGTLTRKHLNISSYRTTSHKTLTEKIAYISAPHDDWVFSLSRAKKSSDYLFSIFNTPDFSAMDWTEKDKRWEGTVDGELRAWITKSMSDQLWYKIPIEDLVYKNDIII